MQTEPTQDIPEMRNRADFYALDPDYVTQPHGRISMTRSAFIGLVLLRAYFLLVIGTLAFRFAEYAHWLK